MKGSDASQHQDVRPNGSDTGPVAFAGIQETGDLAQWEAVSQPWEVLGRPLDGGRFQNRKRFLVTPNCILYSESFGCGPQVSGLTPAGMLGLTLPIRLGAASSYWRSPARDDGIPASLPGALDSRIEAGQIHIILLIRLSHIGQILCGDTVRWLEAAAAQRMLPMYPERRTGLTRYLLSLIDRARFYPDLLAGDAAVSCIERDLVEQLAAAVERPGADTRRPHLSLRRHGLDRALQLLREEDPIGITAAALCSAAGVSERTLEYALRESTGLPPVRFLRRLRMHRTQRALLLAEPGAVTVSQVMRQPRGSSSTVASRPSTAVRSASCRRKHRRDEARRTYRC